MSDRQALKDFTMHERPPSEHDHALFRDPERVLTNALLFLAVLGVYGVLIEQAVAIYMRGSGL